MRKRGKHMLLSEDGWFLLEAAKKGTGFTDTKVTEICFALHCLTLRREVHRARVMLVKHLVQATMNAAEIRKVMHEAALPTKPAKPPVKAVKAK
jgi:hypothetical protein